MAKKSKKQAVEQVENAAAEQAAEVIATAKSRGPRGVKEDAIITVLVEANPKREGSQSHTDFAQYQTGMTVGAFIDAVGKRATPHLVYDAAHGFISIEGYNPEQVVKKERAPKAEKPAEAPRAKKAKAAPAEASPAQQELEGVTVEESLD